MRYQDWDILLFPSGDHVPVQEFKTACYAVREPSNNNNNNGGNANAGDLMPLLTSFIPTMAAGTFFTVSVHSWSQQSPVAGTDFDLSALDLLWEVRVTVDGQPLFTEHLPAATTWPKVISSTNSPVFPTNPGHRSLTSTAAFTEDTSGAMGELCTDLRFPAFDHAVLSQHRWSPDDRAGRIRVEIFGGYARGTNVGEKTAFVKLVNVAAFAFQPAPIELLEHNRISWPNPHMFANPFKSSLSQGPTPPQSAGLNNGFQRKLMHDRKSSFSSMAFSSPMGAMPGAPPPTPTDSMDPRGNMHPLPDFANRYIGRDVSGSTSSSSSYPTIAFDGNGNRSARAYPTALAAGPPQQPLEFRLPPDQIRQIIDGLGARGLNSLNEIQRMVPLPNNILDDASRMPPPPTPMGKKGPPSFQPYGLGQDQFGLLLSSFGDSLNNKNNNNSRRGISRSSDISMHAGCANYPHCIHEDEDGKLWHNIPASAPVTPATVVRGKKEGISLVTSATGTASVTGTAADAAAKGGKGAAPCKSRGLDYRLLRPEVVIVEDGDGFANADAGVLEAPRDFLSKILTDSNTKSNSNASVAANAKADAPARVAGMQSSPPALNGEHDTDDVTLFSSSSPAFSLANSNNNNNNNNTSKTIVGVESTPATATSTTKKRTRSTRRSTNGAESEDLGLSSVVKPRRKSSRKAGVAAGTKTVPSGAVAAAAAATGDAKGGDDAEMGGMDGVAVGDEEGIVVAAAGKENLATGGKGDATTTTTTTKGLRGGLGKSMWAPPKEGQEGFVGQGGVAAVAKGHGTTEEA